jgi:hypothetical protein
MQHIKISLVIFLFIFSIPFLALGQKGETVVPVTAKTNKELKQAWFQDLFNPMHITKDVSGVLIISPFADWDYYYLREKISWVPKKIEYKNKYKKIEVPPGFVTDLASIPKEFWSFLPPAAKYSYAAIIHDYLYWTQTCSREDADKILKIGMQEMEVAPLKVASIYYAVRTFGKSAWKENMELKARGEKRFLKKYPESPQITWEQWKKQKDVFAE